MCVVMAITQRKSNMETHQDSELAHCHFYLIFLAHSCKAIWQKVWTEGAVNNLGPLKQPSSRRSLAVTSYWVEAV